MHQLREMHSEGTNCESEVTVVIASSVIMDETRTDLIHRTSPDGPIPALQTAVSSVTRTSVIRRVPSEASASSGYSTIQSRPSSSWQDLSQDCLAVPRINAVEESAAVAEPGKARKRGAGSRLELPLREKIKVINARDSGKTMRQIATEFGCGKTQILNILSRRDRYQREWEVVCKVGFLGGGADRKRAARRTGNEETNRRVYQWWKEAEANGVRVTGPLLQNTARTIARNLGFENFAASNGWLASFRKTYGVQLKHDLAMERQVGFDKDRTKPPTDLRVPKIEIDQASTSERHLTAESSETIDSKSLVEVLMEDEMESSVSPNFKPGIPSSKSPSLSSVAEEIPLLLNFVMRHAQGYRLIALAYPDEEENWWLEIRHRHASYAVPHFGYRSHLCRLLISQDLGFWLEVLGDCVSWGSLCDLHGDLNIPKLNSILSSMQSDTVCVGSGEVNVKSRDPQQVRFATSAGLSVGAFVSRPDFRYRSFSCSRLVAELENEATCRSCLTLPTENGAWKGQPIRGRGSSDSHPPPPISSDVPRITVTEDGPVSEHLHPKKRMRINYSDEQDASTGLSPSNNFDRLTDGFEHYSKSESSGGSMPIDYSPTRSPKNGS